MEDSPDNSFLRLVRRLSQIEWGVYQGQGFANPYDSYDGNNYNNPYNNFDFFNNSSIFPQTWNQLVFNSPSYISSNIEFDTYQSPDTSSPQGSPFEIFKFNNFPIGIQCKIKTSITIAYNAIPIAEPIRVQLRIVGLPADGYEFSILAGDDNNYITIAPGKSGIFEIETLPFTPSNSIDGVFIQGRILYDDLSTFGDYIFGAQILNSNFEIIQVPESNVINIEYINGQYITNIYDEDGFINTGNIEEEGFDLTQFPYNIPCSLIYLTSSFIPAFGQIYPQVEGSGYDPTIYPFEIPFNSLSQLDLSEDYEIRFAANEELSFPIIGSWIGPLSIDNINDNITHFVLIVARPEGYSLQNNITGDTRQSFLIRRWIPKAGYIYLEAGDPPNGLGKGIIKPEYITKGIQDKIPAIVKDLTDKNLIQ
jgi:hypothetical protein